MEENDASNKNEEMDLITHSLKLLHESPVYVSLHVFQGVAGGSTLQLTCMIKKLRVPFLMDTGSTVSLKPYRYPHNQKNEIERQIKQLLSTEFIRESSSCYASLLVLVKKKDGSWCCCTDFRKLNAMTIKINFLYP